MDSDQSKSRSSVDSTRSTRVQPPESFYGSCTSSLPDFHDDTFPSSADPMVPDMDREGLQEWSEVSRGPLQESKETESKETGSSMEVDHIASRVSTDSARKSEDDLTRHSDDKPTLPLPDIPPPFTSEFEGIINPANPEELAKVSKDVSKRASSVMKLAQENEKLKADLKALTDRLEAAEKRRTALAARRKKEQEDKEAALAREQADEEGPARERSAIEGTKVVDVMQTS